MSGAVEATVLYDRIAFKTSEALDADILGERRLTEYADKGETVKLDSREFKRLSELDPPAVAKSGSKEAEAGLEAPPATVTKPGGGPTDEPTDPAAAGTAPVSEAAVAAALATLRSAHDQGLDVARIMAETPGADPEEGGGGGAAAGGGSEMSDAAEAVYKAGTADDLKKVAASKKIEVEADESKKSLASKLAAAGVTAEDVKASKSS
jgi:hypothetical protein